ncbi:hypothetical protein HRI_000269600 [Hibiscus trionum]|uniref:TF-B3 domain-containing protein n=1 Tax=Hibiscus trionum TaxID=183268 RepID=A0A9W7LIF4_HIBTR|nr:hypothetical protein HRI_000269600 [Hibiscus trionum]
MASHHGRGKGYSPERYHFFKVILESTIRDGKLGIPRKFARDYGNTLSSPVFFEFPNGEVWELELTKHEDEMWVQNGWRKFAEHYSLELGHFLVFRYEGNCHFHVLIFDRSASEIHYPYANGKEGIYHQQVKIEEDDSVQIINNFSTGMRKKLVLQCPRPRKIMNASKNGFSAGKGKVKKLKSYEKSKALMRACSTFESENPFFLVFMQPTYVDVGSDSDSKRSCHVCIPREFSRKYLMDNGDVILSDSNGKTWSAEYRSIHATKQVKLRNGWGAFVRDNNLHVGDVCVFELIDCIDIAFRVFIYGGNHGSPAKMEAGISSTRQECLEPLKVLEGPELPSEESPKVDDIQLGTSRPQTGEDGLNIEKKEYNAYPVSNTFLFSKNKTMFEKGEPAKISLDVISRRGRPRVGSKLPVTALSSPSRPSSSLGSSPKKEVYTEEHEKLLDNTPTSWTLSMDGYGSDGKRIYDSFKGKACHQCRHGEHILEANEKPNWAHPVCHGICNCSLCQQAKGWDPLDTLNAKISKTGFKSVAHDLIKSRRLHTDMEKNPDNTDQVSAKRSLSFPSPALPSEDSREMDDNHLVTSKPQTGEDSFNSKRKEYNAYPESNALLFSKKETVFEISLDVHRDKVDDGKELNFTNKEIRGSPVTLENIPKRKRAFSTEPSADSIAGRLRQRRRCRKDTTGVNGEVLDGSTKNADEGCTATESSPQLMNLKRPASGMENGNDNATESSPELMNLKRPASGMENGNDNATESSPELMNLKRPASGMENGNDNATESSPELMNLKRPASGMENGNDNATESSPELMNLKRPASGMENGNDNATESSPELMNLKRPASCMENGNDNATESSPKQSGELGNDHDKQGSPGANDNASGDTAVNTSSRKKSKTNMKHSTTGTNMDCIARRLRPRSKAL